MNIICPYRDCQQRIGVTPEDAGTQASCPACDRPLKVPELSAFPPEEIAKMGVDGLEIPETPSRLDGAAVLDTPDFRRPAGSAAPAESIAGCPQCQEILGVRAQQVVRQLIELHQAGAKVNGLRIDCSTCGEDVRFHDIVWIEKESKEEEPAESNLSSDKRAAFMPPRTRREIARELSDSGVTAASKGDFLLARSNWVKAAEADHAWSVPFFNLAMLALDSGDPQEASDFIELAEKRASEGTSSGDAKVLNQIPALRTRLEKLDLADSL